MRLSGFADGGHDFPGYASAAAHLVSGDVVGDEPENRGECPLLGLQSILGLGSYRTAWALLHKLRRAMVRPGRERLLTGRAEVDETFVGGEEEGVRGRQTLKKAFLVVIAAEENGAGIGRIRMKRIRRASKQQLHGFIQEAVEPGMQDSTIHTDGWEGYVVSGMRHLLQTPRLEALGYRHEYNFVATSSQSASELLPRVHRVAALLKRWLMGTHKGAVSREHLDYPYLDEYTFRFNRRRSRHRGKLFYRLVQQAAAVGPTTYSEMVQHVRGRRISQDSVGEIHRPGIPTTRYGVAGSEVHTPLFLFVKRSQIWMNSSMSMSISRRTLSIGHPRYVHGNLPSRSRTACSACCRDSLPRRTCKDARSVALPKPNFKNLK